MRGKRSVKFYTRKLLSDGNVLYLNCGSGGGFIDQLSKLIKLYTLNGCSLYSLYLNKKKKSHQIMATQTSSMASHHTKNKNQSLSPTRFSPYYLSDLTPTLCLLAYLAYFQTYLAYSYYSIFIFAFPSSYDVHPPNNWMAHTPTSCKFLQFTISSCLTCLFH